MDQQGQGNAGPNGRRLHIAHRRSPSELTPLMVEQLALQQQIELLQQQQQQIAATHQQYVNMGILQPQAQLQGYSPTMQSQGQAQGQGQGQGQANMPGNAFQFPQPQQQPQPQPQQPQQPQQFGGAGNNSSQPSHRRNQSALPGFGGNMGPPPAPSSGAAYNEYNQGQQANQGQQGNQGRENANQQRRGGGPPGGGHQRRHSLALPEAKKAAEVAQAKRTTSNFQFPAAPAASETLPESAEEKPAPASSTPQPPQGLGVQRAGNIRGGGHSRSQSMAVGNGRPAGAGGRFPFNEGSSGNDGQRRGSHQTHGRTASRNIDNWRQPSNPQVQAQGQGQGQDQQQQQQQQQRSPMGSFGQQQGGGGFQPGHRARGSMASQSVSGIGSMPFQNQPQQQYAQLPQGQMVVNPNMLGGQQLNPFQLAQLQALQQGGQLNGQNLPNQANQAAAQQLSVPQQQQAQQQQQQQQRKTLFTPYLPQANVPALLSEGHLVTGTLRVNKKNRSDAYVTTSDLEADIFICGSKDRNRALEGDLVAVELLDVDEVWGQKREKEEKKKRKDITDTRSGGGSGDKSRSDAGTNGDNQQVAPDGSIRRRGSLRQRPTQKKNDDVEVEGQSLLLVEEEEISDEQKPLYAGHVVAVIERVPGQMFSGSLGLLRPSSQATKEKQEAERQARDGGHSRGHNDRQQDKPKIVWFKPTDKRVPLIAIPTEQAPRDFVENHQNYANDIFVASIKRWPITSLHPFGTLVEKLGGMGNPKVETDALLRDNNFGSDEFSEAVLRSAAFHGWTVESDNAAALSSRRDFRGETTFTIDPNGTKELDDAIHVKSLPDGKVELGIHVADIAHFIKAGSVVDREAKKRGTAVYLMDRVVSMLPPRLSTELCSMLPGEDRLSVSVVFQIDRNTGFVDGDPWIGKGIIRSSGKLSYEEVDAVINGSTDVELHGASTQDIELLNEIATKFRETRFGNRSTNMPALRLLYQLDDENIPVERNIFNSSAAHELIEELSHRANSSIAKFLFTALPEKAFLRHQTPPNSRRLQTFVDRMSRLGYDVDPMSSGSLQNSLVNVQDMDIRKGMETLLIKSLQHAKYYVSSTVRDENRQHYVLNLPLYTHFTSPSRRYADIVVHRQLDYVLGEGSGDYPEEVESLVKTADHCNNKKDSAQTAQEQSVHIESCRLMDKVRNEAGGDLISEGIVLCVYESAFDVLIPEYGFEKRVHCDQLPLKKAEFRQDTRVLELYWEKGVPSSAFIPEDERPRSFGSRAGGAAAAAAREAEAAKERAQEREEAQRKQTETGTMSTDAVDALFDDDDSASEITEMTAGVSLNSPDRNTQSMPPSPTRNGVSQQGPHRTQSDPKIASSATDAPETKMSNKEKYLSFFKLREEDGEHIQDVTEMTRLPIILKTDLSKSPPCLTIRSVNPYAL